MAVRGCLSSYYSSFIIIIALTYTLWETATTVIGQLAKHCDCMAGVSFSAMSQGHANSD